MFPYDYSEGTQTSNIIYGFRLSNINLGNSVYYYGIPLSILCHFCQKVAKSTAFIVYAPRGSDE